MKNLVNLRLHREYQISTITFKKIELQLIRPFKIVERIKRFVYRLKLLLNMRIHDVISVVYLESAIDSVENLYQRCRLLASAVIIEKKEKYEIKKLLKKRNIRRKKKMYTIFDKMTRLWP